MGDRRWSTICQYTDAFKASHEYQNPSNFICDKELKKDLREEFQQEFKGKRKIYIPDLKKRIFARVDVPNSLNLLEGDLSVAIPTCLFIPGMD